VLGTINGTGRLAWFFSLPWMRYIGLISFSLYLWHRGAMLIAFRLELDGYVAAWGTFLLALLIAAISYHCIEKPLLKIRI
jgi:peptidoglycan/LPS O-acetylase OafA/YrhL